MSKRIDYLSWDGYFMSIAFLNSLRSKDPDTRHGACVVNNENKIIGNGYNGFPNKCSDNDFSWEREGKDNKYLYVVHSEVNSILNSNGNVKNCRMYLFSEKSYYPCNECAKIIIQSGIKEILMASAIVSNTDKYDFLATKKMFNSSGVITKLIRFNDICKDFLFISEEFQKYTTLKNIELIEGKIEINKES